MEPQHGVLRDTHPATANDQLITMSNSDFKKGLINQLQQSNVIGTVKSQLRAQLLSQIQKGKAVSLAGSTGPVSLKRRALNSMLVEYLNSAQYQYSLSVFSEESGAGAAPSLSEAELLDVLRIDRKSLLFQAYTQSKDGQGPDSKDAACVLLHLLDALVEVGHAGRGSDSSTQTGGGDKYQLEMKMQQLEHEYQTKIKALRAQPGHGTEERMAIFRQQIEDQARADVARQVERVREVEMASVRLEEASKWRKSLEGERLELERVHQERLSKLRGREEELSDKFKRQQREIESLAFDHRQRLLREEERLRAWRQEAQSALDGREEQLKHLARALELREKAVVSREVAAETKAAQAAQAVGTAHVNARAEVEKEYLELKATLSAQRLQLEMDRARVSEMRSESAAESAAARAKEDRLRAVETARMEAEARAAAHAAEAASIRLQVERLQLELTSVQDELSRKVSQAADSADAMLSNAAGALGMLEREAHATRGTSIQLRAVQEEMLQVKAALSDEVRAKETVISQLDAANARAEAEARKVRQLSQQLSEMAALAEEALSARTAAKEQADDARFAVQQLQRDLADTRASLARTRDEAMLLRLQCLPGGATNARASPWVSQRATPTGLDMHGAGGGMRPASGLAMADGGRPYALRAASPGVGGDAGGGIRLPVSGAAGPQHVTSQVYVLSPARQPAAGYMPGAGGGGDDSGVAVPALPVGLHTKESAEAVSPIRERLARLNHEEAESAAITSSFKRRVAEQQEAGARELQLVMTSVALNSPTSSLRTSLTGGPDSRPLSPARTPRSCLSPSHSFKAPSEAAYPSTSLASTSQPGYVTLPAHPLPWGTAQPSATVLAPAIAGLEMNQLSRAVHTQDGGATAPASDLNQLQVARNAAGTQDDDGDVDGDGDQPPTRVAVAGRRAQEGAGSQGGFRALATPSSDVPASVQGSARGDMDRHGSLLDDAASKQDLGNTNSASLSFSEHLPSMDPPRQQQPVRSTATPAASSPAAVQAATGQGQPKPGLPPLPASKGWTALPALPVSAPAPAAAVPVAVAAPAGLTLVQELSGQASSISTISDLPLPSSRKASDTGSAQALAKQGTGAGSEARGGFMTAVDDIQSVQAAKLKLLQEQQEARLAAARAAQGRPGADSAAGSDEDEDYDEDFVDGQASSTGSSDEVAEVARRSGITLPGLDSSSSSSGGKPAAVKRAPAAAPQLDDDDDDEGNSVSGFNEPAGQSHGLTSIKASLYQDEEEDMDDDDDGLQLETAEETQPGGRPPRTRYPSNTTASSADGGRGGRGSGSGSRVSEGMPGDLEDGSVGEDSDLVVDLDDDDDASSQGVGAGRRHSSSDSVF